MNSRKTNLLFILSVAINLIVVGGLIGFWIKDKPGPRFPSHLTSILQDIDPDHRRELRQRLKEIRSEGKQLHRTLRQQQKLLGNTIESSPFDEQAVLNAFAQTRKAREEIEAHMHNQLVDVMKDLSPEQRTRLLQSLSRNPQHRNQHHPQHSNGPPKRP